MVRRKPRQQKGAVERPSAVPDLPQTSATAPRRTAEVETVDPPLTVAVTRRLLRQTIYFAALVGLVIWFLFSVRRILPLFLFAFILAYVLSVPVEWVGRVTARYRVPRGASVLLVYVVLLAILEER